jgi:hypothetical protein
MNQKEDPKPLHMGRNLEKDRSRLEDELAITSGQKSIDQVWRENFIFSDKKVRIDFANMRAHS